LQPGGSFLQDRHLIENPAGSIGKLRKFYLHGSTLLNRTWNGNSDANAAPSNASSDSD
jgi:hypothetical protein